MPKLKQKKLLVLLLAAWICICLGIISAHIARSQLRYEEFRMDRSSAQNCPNNLNEVQCKITPIYNPESSGGYEGYPLVSGKYFCTTDSTCLTTTETIYPGNIKTHTLNQAIFSIFYFLIFLVFLWIRKRVRHNRSKSEDPVS